MPTRRKRPNIDRYAHRVVPRVIRMQIVPRQLGKLAVRQEFRLHVAGCGIERRFIEIDHAIEESRRTDEIVEHLAIGIDRRSIVPGGQERWEVDQIPPFGWIVETQCGRHRRAVHLDALRVQPADHVLVARDDVVGRVSGAEIVDALSQITCVSPDSPSTSRSSRSTAAGPEVALATMGFTTRLPPIASLTMLTLLP